MFTARRERNIYSQFKFIKIYSSILTNVFIENKRTPHGKNKKHIFSFMGMQSFRENRLETILIISHYDNKEKNIILDSSVKCR